MMDVYKFYECAQANIIAAGYECDIRAYENLDQENITKEDFLDQYVWCVLSAGMAWHSVRSIYDHYKGYGVDGIGHPGKRHAIRDVTDTIDSWYRKLQWHIADPKDVTDFLETMPWIGPVTKWHLAKNLGFDVIKPDRHLVRLAETFEFNTPWAMCKAIQERTGDKLSKIDTILWRWSEIFGTASLVSQR